MSESIEYLTNVLRNAFDEINAGLAKTPVAIFKPEFGVDGNQFYFLLGKDLQSGIAGFGSSPAEAADDFNHQFYNFKLGKTK